MTKIRGFAIIAALLIIAVPARADGWRKDGNEVELMNAKIRGKVVDHTANHGVDRRIWSRTLYQRRDLYVYLPPGYNRCQKYPLMIFLHDCHRDERSFLRHIVPALDDAIKSCRLPPMIVAAPDGSIKGEGCAMCAGCSFFLNTSQGDFADFVQHDMWDFVCKHYSIRSERQAHILMGVGMGGFAAYNYAFKHREAFGTVIGIMPALNMRWTDKLGNVAAKFNPCQWGWKKELECKKCCRVPGCKTKQLHAAMESLYGCCPQAISAISCENPIEMLDRYRICPGQLEMYVGYAGQDEYNLHSQAESFLYFAKFRHLPVGVGYDRHGHHNMVTAERLLPGVFCWLAPRIAPYSPCAGCCPSCACPPPQPCLTCSTATPPRRVNPVRRLLRPRAQRPSNDFSCGYPINLPDPSVCK